MAKTKTLKFKRTIKAPPPEVYRALTRSSALRQWFSDAAQLEARKGGRVYFGWNDGYGAMGEVTAVEPDKKIALTWLGKDEPESTQVQITLRPTPSNGGTVVSVAHAGFGAGKKWADTVKGLETGWQASLENLQSVIETGEDLRIVRRPMLGISDLEELNAERAARLGVPVRDGVRIGGLVEGMGAQAAGLQKDDVIVSLGGKKVNAFPALVNALQAHHAGDQVPVIFYRGGEKRTLTMTLSRRPVPAMPPTPAAFAEALRAQYAESDARLAPCFEGVSEAEAAHRPAPKEWSAKEIVAHIIAGERDTHAFIADLITDCGRSQEDFENELTARPSGTLAVYPTNQALLEELKRAEAETAAMVAALPPEFVARRRSYWQLSFSLLQPPGHVDTHLDQIRAAIASARRG
jgi:uncharacterized protein YndB with AHSA1/START domain